MLDGLPPSKDQFKVLPEGIFVELSVNVIDDPLHIVTVSFTA